MIFPLDTPGESQPAALPRTRVKICGLTHPDDAALAISLGADALGLNFYPGSPRCLDVSRDGGWLRALGGQVRRVAVVVNASLDDLRRLLDEGVVDAVQLHGDEDAAFCATLAAEGIPFAKAIRVRDADSLRNVERFGTSDLVLDAFRADAYGGTGKTIDWVLAAEFARAVPPPARRTILSGGLTPENVAEAIARVRPYGVDVASGVEGEGDRRRKDPARVRQFLATVKAADRGEPLD